MFGGLKSFAINKILRHIADNPKLNKATNFLAIIPAVITAVLAIHPNWDLTLQCCVKPGSLGEVTRLSGAAIVAVLLWFCGKFPGLKGLLPVVNDIIQEAEKEAQSK